MTISDLIMCCYEKLKAVQLHVILLMRILFFVVGGKARRYSWHPCLNLLSQVMYTLTILTASIILFPSLCPSHHPSSLPLAAYIISLSLSALALAASIISLSLHSIHHLPLPFTSSIISLCPSQHPSSLSLSLQYPGITLHHHLRHLEETSLKPKGSTQSKKLGSLGMRLWNSFKFEESIHCPFT